MVVVVVRVTAMAAAAVRLLESVTVTVMVCTPALSPILATDQFVPGVIVPLGCTQPVQVHAS